MTNRTSLLILAAATLLVYSVSFFNNFVMDDEVIIVNNPQTFSLRNIPDVLLAPDLIKPYYRPLNRATYLVDYRLAGMNPAWYHGVNILLHLGNVFLLYLVCRRLLPDRTAALIAALVFGVHPVNSEAVNFVSARNTLLALFFSMASLLVFMDAREKGKRFPLLSALFLFCGLLSKETALMTMVVVVLYTLVPLQGAEVRKQWQGRILFLSPYLLSTMLYIAMRSYSLQGVVGTGVPADGLFGRLAQNYHIIPQYLGLLLFPVDLTLFHKVPQGGLFDPPWFLPAWLLLLAAVALVIRSRNRVALFCMAWLVIHYAPISNIVPIPSDQLTERYLYMPAIGFFILLGVLYSLVPSREGTKWALWGGTAVVVIAFAALTVQRNLDWKNNLSLFSSGARNDPSSPAAHYNLGTAYLENGDLVTARQEWEKTLAIDPAYADALTQMGTLSAVQGDLPKAEQYYLAALQAPVGVSDPDKSMAYYNLGKIYEKRNQPQWALHYYRQFLKNVPITYLEYKPDAERRIAHISVTLPSEPAR
jgi:tetratricopeptide (TPR) repeat protein